MASNFPTSYKDPLYASLDAQTEKKLSLPVGLLASIRTVGERSNADQVSEKGAQTPYQFTPPTRKAILDKYGIDVTLSPETASQGAGLLLQESLQRNNNDVERAVREYHGGVKPENWGPINNAYAKRVLASQAASKMPELSRGFAEFMAANPAVPADRAAPTAQGSPAAPAAAAPAGDALSEGFGQYLASNPTPAADTAPPETGLGGMIKEAFTGEKRTTPEVQAALNEGRSFYDMPETNELSMGLVKSTLGGFFANSKERAQIMAANLPGVTVREDAMGNQWLKSAKDGKEYVIEPGFTPQDVPRAVGAAAAFTPAGRATSVTGAALASGATQGAIELSQAATGGQVDPGDILAAGVAGAALPAVVKTVKAAANPIKEVIRNARGLPDPTIPPGAPPPAAPVMSAEELAATTRQAAAGGIGSKGATAQVAAQTMPNAKTVEAAKRLGIDEYLQPDHVTTNQAYRELAQAVKSVPGAETRAAETQGLEEVAKRADDLVTEIGGSRDVSTLNSTIKDRMTATQKELSDKADEAYANLRAAIPARSEAGAPTVLKFIENRAADLDGFQNLTAMERRIANKLMPKQGLNEAGEEVTKQPTYALLDDVRRDLTAARINRQGPFKDADTGLIKKLERELMTDQRAAVEALGMLDQFKAAQGLVAVRKGLEDDMVALFGKELNNTIVGKLSTSMAALPKGDVAKLSALLKAIPENMRQETVASGLANAFNVSAKNQAFSFKNYAQWYEGLLQNRQAHNLLFSNLPPAARKQMSDLYRVSKGISDATKERITTGRIMAVKEELRDADSLMGNIYDLAKRSSIGAAAEVGTSAAGMPGVGMSAAIASALTKGKPDAMKAADKLIASPEFLEAAKRAGTAEAGAAARRLGLSKAFKDFARALKNPRELSSAEKWIQRAMLTTNAMSEDTTTPPEKKD